jgi:hypothetical protein
MTSYDWTRVGTSTKTGEARAARAGFAVSMAAHVSGRRGLDGFPSHQVRL